MWLVCLKMRNKTKTTTEFAFLLNIKFLRKSLCDLYKAQSLQLSLCDK